MLDPRVPVPNMAELRNKPRCRIPGHLSPPSPRSPGINAQSCPLACTVIDVAVPRRSCRSLGSLGLQTPLAPGRTGLNHFLGPLLTSIQGLFFEVRSFRAVELLLRGRVALAETPHGRAGPSRQCQPSNVHSEDRADRVTSHVRTPRVMSHCQMAMTQQTSAALVTHLSASCRPTGHEGCLVSSTVARLTPKS